MSQSEPSVGTSQTRDSTFWNIIGRNIGLVIIGLMFIWVLLPWLAPVLMEWGQEGPARAIYFLYSFQCHQLPQRSYFLFGEQFTYSLDHIQAAWQTTTDPMVLREFVGNAAMGYKVAWSDRMVSAYGSIPVAGLLLWPWRRRLPKLPLWGFALFLLPMALDGGTHMISDLAGFGHGFRFENQWLVQISNGLIPARFAAGTSWGTFNSLMRLVTGIIFGFGLAWFVLPWLPDSKPAK